MYNGLKHCITVLYFFGGGGGIQITINKALLACISVLLIGHQKCVPKSGQ